jgi:hypothetical protein
MLYLVVRRETARLYKVNITEIQTKMKVMQSGYSLPYKHVAHSVDYKTFRKII